MEETDPAENERESTPDSDFASVIESEANKNRSATKKKRRIRETNHHKSYKRSWRAASPLTKLMIYLTAVIAVSTLVYSIFSGWQWHEIRSSSEDTRKIAQAARDSADAAQRQAGIAVDQLQAVKDSAQAAKDSASAASTATEQNKEMVRAAQTQANTSQVAARAAEASAKTARQSFALTQRPSVYFDRVVLEPFKVGEPPEVRLVVKNGGGANAYRITVDTVFSYHRKPVSEKLKYPAATGYGIVGSPILVPGGNGLQVRARAEFVMSDASITAVTETKTQLLVFWGSGEYFDGLGRRYPMEDFCFLYSPDEKRLIFCAGEIETERRHQNPN